MHIKYAYAYVNAVARPRWAWPSPMAGALVGQARPSWARLGPSGPGPDGLGPNVPGPNALALMGPPGP